MGLEPISRRRRSPRDEHRAAAPARHHSATDGSRRGLHAVVLRVRTDPADRLRQRRQPVAGARRGASAGDRHSPLARRVAAPHRPPADDRERAARAGRGRRRLSGLARGARGHGLLGHAHDARRSRRRQSQRARRRLARRGVPGRCGDGRHGVLRADAGAAGDADRAGADDARRAGEGRAARTRAQRADWRAGVRLGAAADLRRDLPAQRDRVVAVRSGVSHGRHGLDRASSTSRSAPPCSRRSPANRRSPHTRPSGRGCWPRRAQRSPTPAPARRRSATEYVSAGYFDVLGIPIVRGRPFTAAERDDHPVVDCSESVARALWPNGDGVGETFRLEQDLDARRRGH